RDRKRLRIRSARPRRRGRHQRVQSIPAAASGIQGRPHRGAVQLSVQYAPKMMEIKHRFQLAMGAYFLLAVLATATLDGKIRLAVLIFLGGLAARTVIHYKARE